MKNRPSSPRNGSRILSSRPARLLMLVALIVGSLCISPAAGVQAAQGPQLLETRSDANGTVLEIRAPDYQLVDKATDGGTCQMLSAAGLGQMDEVGRPMVPVQGTMLGLPPGAAPQIRILEAEFDTITLPADLCPVPTPVVRGESGPDGAGPGEAHVEMVYAKDGGAYATNAFYPANLAVSTGEAHLRDQRVMQLSVRPFQYNPVSRELRVYHTLRVEVSFAYPQGRQDLGASGETGGPFETTLQHAILNYDAARQWRQKSTVLDLTHGSACRANGVRARLQSGREPRWPVPTDLRRPGSSRDAGRHAEPTDLPAIGQRAGACHPGHRPGGWAVRARGQDPLLR